MDLLTKAAPKLIDYGALGISCLLLIALVIVLGKLLLNAWSEIKELHKAHLADEKAWGREKLELVKQMIEADHENTATLQAVVAAVNAMKSSSETVQAAVRDLVNATLQRKSSR